MDKIDQILNRVAKLPPAPQLLPRLLHALNDVDADLSQVVDLITFDPALTAKLLQVCNSAVYRGDAQVNDVSEAVNRLGLQLVYRIVAMVVGVKSFAQSAASGGANTGMLWRHAVTSAFAAQFVAEDVATDSGLLFTAGLLHDIGQTIMMEVFKGNYSPTVSKNGQEARALIERETQRFGANHAEVGARLLERWNFSPHLVACARHHHDPAGAGEDAPLAACVNLGDSIAYCVEQETSGTEFSWSEAEPALEILQLTAENLPRYLERIKENLEFVEAMCRMQG